MKLVKWEDIQLPKPPFLLHILFKKENEKFKAICIVADERATGVQLKNLTSNEERYLTFEGLKEFIRNSLVIVKELKELDEIELLDYMDIIEKTEQEKTQKRIGEQTKAEEETKKEQEQKQESEKKQPEQIEGIKEIINEIEEPTILQEKLQSRTLSPRKEKEDKKKDTVESTPLKSKFTNKLLPRKKALPKIPDVNLTVPSLNAIQKKALVGMLNKINSEVNAGIESVTGIQTGETVKIVIRCG